MNTQNKNILAYLALFCFFGLVGIVLMPILHTPKISQTASAALAYTPPHIQSRIQSPPNLKAKSAYVYDITTHTILLDHNMNVQLPLASLTKIALTLIAKEDLSPNSTILITKKSLEPEGDWGLVIGDSWKRNDLIAYTLMVSSNDGAEAIAEAIQNKTKQNVKNLLNTFAKDHQLNQTYFFNETGLDVNSTLGGAYGSAKNVGTLLLYAYEHASSLFASTAQKNATFTTAHGLIYNATNTNEAIGKLPGIVMGKTGFTDLAGGNLGIVTEIEPGHPIVIVVLGSTKEGRFDDVIALLRSVHQQSISGLIN